MMHRGGSGQAFSAECRGGCVAHAPNRDITAGTRTLRAQSIRKGSWLNITKEEHVER